MPWINEVSSPNTPEVSMKPSIGIVLYKTARASSVCQVEHTICASIHEVQMRKSGPAFLPGKFASSKEMESWMETWVSRGESETTKPKTKAFGASWIPPEALAVEEGTFMAWFWKGRVRTLHFKVQQMKEPISVCVPLPSLVIGVRDKNLVVAAVGTNRRPTATQKLYHAPFMNLYAEGTVCQGSGRLSGIGPYWKDKHEWESVLFDTAFSHLGDEENTLSPAPGRKKKVTEAGHVRFWKQLEKDKAKRFPHNRLIPLGMTLAELIETWRR